MQLVQLGEEALRDFFSGGAAPDKYCRSLEEGKILFFPQTPFEMPGEEVEFLLGRRQTGAQYHKNIAYRPRENRVTGAAKSGPEENRRLVEALGRYSRSAAGFLARLLPPYAERWRLDYASFRPQEEKGRDVKFKARNDLLHVDAFPTRPTRGDRILRFFTNINPARSRHWITSEPFDALIVSRFAEGMPRPSARQPLLARLRRGAARALAGAGLPVTARSRYDEFMLGFHDYLKENESFQEECPKYEWQFPPQSSWAVFTDSVPHAALEGQFALEQTFIVSRGSLILPEKAPITVLEKLCGFALAPQP